ncbi:very short patch repair endonuclease [Paenibacillus sp. S-38]|uniref:very short patch repair endonuclease n=1 Tax=Paenibacillus sp. S-38 TaxID=3416710 RepID=UPI003CF09B69
MNRKLETTDKRRKNMAAIRPTHSKLEDKVTKSLWKKGFRFRKNVTSLYGKPDIAIQKYRIVIFIDSCFWHACPIHGNIPKNNRDFWAKKLERNVQRDKEVTYNYEQRNWNILRIWEHEISRDFAAALDKISNFIEAAKLNRGG